MEGQQVSLEADAFIFEVQFLPNIISVNVNGSFCQVQYFCNLFSGFILFNMVRNLDLLRTQVDICEIQILGKWGNNIFNVRFDDFNTVSGFLVEFIFS